MRGIIGTDTFHEVWSSIARNPRRSILTAFGVFWGMLMLVVMLSLGSGITNSILGEISYIPKNLSICWTDNTSIAWQGFRKGRSWDLRMSDIREMEKQIPELVMSVPLVTPWQSNVRVVNRDKSGTYRIKGVDASFIKVCPVDLKEGRYINDLDVQECRKVCVLGEKIVDEVYKGISPVGTYVLVGGVSYQCVGIVNRTTQNMNMGGSDEESITLPYTLVQRIYNMGDDISFMMIQAREDVPIESIEDRMREVLCTRHQICPDDKKALTFMNLDRQLKVFLNLCTGITALLWIVGLGTLLSGAIGVSNIVMITVKERTREIGVRRAIGARPVAIISQILAESLFLTAAAGLLGFLLGVALMSMPGLQEMQLGDSGMTLVNPMISFATGIASLSVIVTVGLAAGILPAMRAMKIKAIDAIREE